MHFSIGHGQHHTVRPAQFFQLLALQRRLLHRIIDLNVAQPFFEIYYMILIISLKAISSQKISKK